MNKAETTAETLSEGLTVLQLVLDGRFEVEGFDQGCLMQHQRVAHAVDVDALGRHPDAQLWHVGQKDCCKIIT